MNAVAATRHTAEERREEILRAAVVEFGRTGLHGTSTETIARAVGVSQPYLFRLFGSKKQLFIAAVNFGFDHTIAIMRAAGESATDRHDAFLRIGDAYLELISDRRHLGIQLQAYASADDPEIQGVVRGRFGEMVEDILRFTNATPEQLAEFLGRGMLLNVASSMGVLESKSGWAQHVYQGCIGGFEDPE